MMLEGMEKWMKEEEEEEKVADFESFLLSANGKIEQLPGFVISYRFSCFKLFLLVLFCPFARIFCVQFQKNLFDMKMYGTNF
jgi:hypothetical protein